MCSMRGLQSSRIKEPPEEFRSAFIRVRLPGVFKRVLVVDREVAPTPEKGFSGDGGSAGAPKAHPPGDKNTAPAPVTYPLKDKGIAPAPKRRLPGDTC